MRSAVVIAGCATAWAACGHAVPAPAPDVVGPVWTERMTAESDVAYQVDTGIWIPAARQQWQRTTWEREIAMIDAARARITYRSYDTRWTLSGTPEQTERGPLAGHTYVVARTPAGLAITDGDGDDVPAREAAALASELRGFGAPDAIAAIVRDGPPALDARFALDEAVVAQLVGGDAPDHYAGRAVVIDSTPTRVALGVEIEQRRIDAADHSEIRNDLRGTLVIDPVGRRAVALELAGRLEVVQHLTRAGHALDVEGVGHAKLSWASRPSISR